MSPYHLALMRLIVKNPRYRLWFTGSPVAFPVSNVVFAYRICNWRG